MVLFAAFCRKESGIVKAIEKRLKKEKKKDGTPSLQKAEFTDHIRNSAPF
jgi:hypothetical protein